MDKDGLCDDHELNDFPPKILHFDSATGSSPQKNELQIVIAASQQELPATSSQSGEAEASGDEDGWEADGEQSEADDEDGGGDEEQNWDHIDNAGDMSDLGSGGTNDSRSSSADSYASSWKSYMDYSGDDEIVKFDNVNQTWKDDEPPQLQLNEDAIKHTATYYIPGNHGTCVDISYRTRGTFHEIYDLHFADGWKCIGRFTREPDEPLAKMESEVATSEYVRTHTKIPVPEIYLYNFNPQHVVGSAFVFMERMEGISMYKLWEHASTKRKLVMIKQVASVVAQLADLKFDSIGKLRLDGGIAPLKIPDSRMPQRNTAPFASLFEDAMSCLDENAPNLPEAVRSLFPALRENMRVYLEEEQAGNGALGPPFRLRHGDFDYQNILFTQGDGEQDLKLSAVIDWDHSETTPLYFLCEYPIYIQDLSCSDTKKYFKANKACRKQFVSSILHHYAKGSAERSDVRWCFREKCYRLNQFWNIFIWDWLGDSPSEREDAIAQCKRYVDVITGVKTDGWAAPYGGTPFWEPDSEPESED